MHIRTFWSGKRRRALKQILRLPFGKLRVAQDFGRRLRLCKSRSFDSLRSLRTSPAGSDARKTAQIKTGAYSPPRFSAPALKAPTVIGRNQAAHLLSANLFAEQRRVCEIKKWVRSSVLPCLAAARRVNEKGGRSIYLVDNKQGGIDFGCLMYTVPNSNYCGAF